MALQDEFDRFAVVAGELTQAKAAIRAEIEALGVPVPGTAKLAVYNTYVAQLGAAGGYIPTIESVSIVPGGGGTVGVVLTASVSGVAAVPAPVLTYQWKLDGMDVGGETASTYTTDAPGDVSVVATATNSQGFASIESAAVTVASAAPVLSAITFTPIDPVVGQPITASATATNGGVVTWLWPDGTTGAEYTPAPADNLTSLIVTATATNAFGSDSGVAATGTVRFAAPVAVGTIPAFDLDVSATDLIFDVSPFFSVEGDPDLAFQSAAFSVVGTGVTVASPSSPVITIDRSSAISATTFTVTASNSGGSASQTASLTVTASQDTTPPLLSGATSTASSLGYVSNENDGTLFWVLDTTAATDAADVIALVGSSGGVRRGSFTVTGGAQSSLQTGGASWAGLSGAHFLSSTHRDAAGNVSNMVVTEIDIEAADVTAPVLTPGTLTFGTTTAERPVSTDEGNGTLWRLVDGNASRTAAQVKAAGLSVPVTASGAQGAQTWTGLTPATGYNFHLMHEDTAGNQSTVSSAAFTTATAGAGINVEQTVLAVSSSSNGPYAGSITVGSASNRAVLAFVHGYNTDSETVISARTPPDDEPGVVTISLDGTTMAPLVAPQIANSARAWSAVYWVPAPPTGTLAFSMAVDETQRATAVTLVEMSGIAQSTPVVFTATAITNEVSGSLTPTQSFPSRTLAAAGNKMFLTATLDTGAMALPTAIGGDMLLAAQTGPLATSDATHAVVCRDASGVVGLQMDANRRGILHMIELEAV